MAVSAAAGRVFVRILDRTSIWFVSVCVSALPALSEGDVPLSFHLGAMAASVNKNGHFQDLYFIIIALSIVSITNLVDNCLRNLQKIHPLLRWPVTPALLGYILILVYATSRFRSLAELHGIVPPMVFESDWHAIKVILVATAITEVFIAMAAKEQP